MPSDHAHRIKSDTYTWNNPHALDRAAIDAFLNVASLRIETQPGSLPLNQKAAQATVSWLRGLTSKTPSEIEAP